jgi:hypothetical protein
MFSSDIVEVAIGLAFMYFVLSLICSTITEFITRMVAMRAITLEGAVRNLLSEAKPLPKTKKGSTKDQAEPRNSLKRLKAAELVKAQKSDTDPDYYFAKFYAHPMIAQLSRQGTGKALKGRSGRPSYITPHDFALVLLDVILPADTVQGSKTFDEIRKAVQLIQIDLLKKPLLVLLDEAEGDVKKLREGIENWFNANMDRVEGWYRRKAQLLALGLAVVVVLALNADTLAVARTLSTNASVRNSVVAAAEAVVKDPPKQDDTTVDITAVTKQVEELTQSLQKPGFPVGWQMPLTPTQRYNADSALHGKPPLGKAPTAWDDIFWGFYKFIGLAMTALLISLGAPFWFDLLNKLVNLRATGKPPETSAPEPAQTK